MFNKNRDEDNTDEVERWRHQKQRQRQFEIASHNTDLLEDRRGGQEVHRRKKQQSQKQQQTSSTSPPYYPPVGVMTGNNNNLTEEGSVGTMTQKTKFQLAQLFNNEPEGDDHHLQSAEKREIARNAFVQNVKERKEAEVAEIEKQKRVAEGQSGGKKGFYASGGSSGISSRLEEVEGPQSTPSPTRQINLPKALSPSNLSFLMSPNYQSCSSLSSSTKKKQAGTSPNFKGKNLSCSSDGGMENRETATGYQLFQDAINDHFHATLQAYSLNERWVILAQWLKKGSVEATTLRLASVMGDLLTDLEQSLQRRNPTGVSSSSAISLFPTYPSEISCATVCTLLNNLFGVIAGAFPSLKHVTEKIKKVLLENLYPDVEALLENVETPNLDVIQYNVGLGKDGIAADEKEADEILKNLNISSNEHSRQQRRKWFERMHQRKEVEMQHEEEQGGAGRGTHVVRVSNYETSLSAGVSSGDQHNVTAHLRFKEQIAYFHKKTYISLLKKAERESTGQHETQLALHKAASKQIECVERIVSHWQQYSVRLIFKAWRRISKRCKTERSRREMSAEAGGVAISGTTCMIPSEDGSGASINISESTDPIDQQLAQLFVATKAAFGLNNDNAQSMLEGSFNNNSSFSPPISAISPEDLQLQIFAFYQKVKHENSELKEKVQILRDQMAALEREKSVLQYRNEQIHSANAELQEKNAEVQEELTKLRKMAMGFSVPTTLSSFSTQDEKNAESEEARGTAVSARGRENNLDSEKELMGGLGYRKALQQLTKLTVQLQDLRSNLSGCMRLSYYPGLGISLPVAEVSPERICQQFLQQCYGKKISLDNVGETVNALVENLLARDSEGSLLPRSELEALTKIENEEVRVWRFTESCARYMPAAFPTSSSPASGSSAGSSSKGNKNTTASGGGTSSSNGMAIERNYLLKADSHILTQFISRFIGIVQHVLAQRLCPSEEDLETILLQQRHYIQALEILMLGGSSFSGGKAGDKAEQSTMDVQEVLCGDQRVSYKLL